MVCRHISFADPDRNLACGYAMNKCVTPGLGGARSPGYELVNEVYRVLEMEEGRL